MLSQFITVLKTDFCIDPPVVQNSTHNGSPESGKFPLETVLKYTCDPGYIMVGFAHAKCFLSNDTTMWFGPDMSCEGKLLIHTNHVKFPYNSHPELVFYIFNFHLQNLIETRGIYSCFTQ